MNENLLDMLIYELECFKRRIYKSKKINEELFTKEFKEFRKFITTNSFENGKYSSLIENLKRHKKYRNLKKFFYKQECYWEFIEEVKEKENIKKIVNKQTRIDTKLIREKVKNRFSIETIDNAEKEAQWIGLEKYDNIVMVGCGSFPFTLLSFAYKYPEKTFIGIDLNKNAIENAIELKELLKVKNIKFKLYSGKSYDYKDAELILIADLASKKRDILNQIYKTNKEARVIIRNPILYGILICDEVELEKEKRYKLIDTFLPNDTELYINLLIENRNRI